MSANVVKINAAISAAAASGGVVLVDRRLGNIVVDATDGPIMLASNVTVVFDWSATTSKPGPGTIGPLIVADPGYSGYVIDSPSSAIYGPNVIGAKMIADSTPANAANQGGLRHRNVQGGRSTSLVASGFGLAPVSVIGRAHGIGDSILQRVIAAPTALSLPSGALETYGTDNYAWRVQANGGHSGTIVDTANLRSCGIMWQSHYGWITDCNGELADTGVWLQAVNVKLNGVRGDINNGRGWYLQATAVGNSLTNCQALGNSRAGSGLYDGFVTEDVTSQNLFTNCWSGGISGFLGQRVGFKDYSKPYALPDKLRNRYVLCQGDSNTVIDLAPNVKTMLRGESTAGPIAINPAPGALETARPQSVGKPSPHVNTATFLPSFSDGTNWRDTTGAIDGNTLPQQSAEGRASWVFFAGPGAATITLDDRDAPADRAGVTKTVVTSGGTYYVTPNPVAVAVAAQTWTALVSVKSSISRTCRVGIQWYDGSLTPLSTSFGAPTASTTTWGTYPANQLAVVTATAPSTTAFARLIVEVQAAVIGDVHAVTLADLGLGTNPYYREP